MAFKSDENTIKIWVWRVKRESYIFPLPAFDNQFWMNRRAASMCARAEIHKSIRELAAGGVGVMVISSEVEELPGLCDRVLVMVEGRVAGELVGPDISKEAILQLSYAHGQE